MNDINDNDSNLIHKIKKFFIDIFENGNFTQKVFLFLFFFNLLVFPIIFLTSKVLGSESRYDTYFIKYNFQSGFTISEFFLWIILFLLCVISIKLFKSKNS